MSPTANIKGIIAEGFLGYITIKKLCTMSYHGNSYIEVGHKLNDNLQLEREEQGEILLQSLNVEYELVHELYNMMS